MSTHISVGGSVRVPKEPNSVQTALAAERAVGTAVEPPPYAYWDAVNAHRAEYRDWQHEVANGDTLMGFHDWLEQKAEQDTIEEEEQ